MSFEDLLIHTCDISHPTDGAADGYGQPAKTWANSYNSQPCRLVPTGGREIKQGLQVVISDWELLTGNITVTEVDRVVINGETYEILLVQPRSDGAIVHHKELALQKVK